MMKIKETLGKSFNLVLSHIVFITRHNPKMRGYYRAKKKSKKKKNYYTQRAKENAINFMKHQQQQKKTPYLVDSGFV